MNETPAAPAASLPTKVGTRRGGLAPIVVPPEFPYIKLRPDDRAAQSREFRASLKDRLGFKWVEDMYARHRGKSAEVAA